MLVLFAVILGGIVTGRLLQSRRLAFVSRLIAVIIWALLFLLGLEVGSDPAVVGGMATLGRTAFVIFVFSVAGSIGASWLLWRRIRGRTASGTEGAAANPASAGSVAGRGFGAGGGGCGANGFSGSVADQSSEALPNPAGLLQRAGIQLPCRQNGVRHRARQRLRRTPARRCGRSSALHHPHEPHAFPPPGTGHLAALLAAARARPPPCFGRHGGVRWLTWYSRAGAW